MRSNLISIDAPSLPGSPLDRLVINDYFMINRYGELSQRTECHQLLETGETFQEAGQNPEYDEETRRAYLTASQPIVVLTTTQDSFVDSRGNLVDEDHPDAHAQRDWFQGLTLANLRQMGMVITDDTSLWSIIRQFMLREMTRSVRRNKYGGYVEPAPVSEQTASATEPTPVEEIPVDPQSPTE